MGSAALAPHAVRGDTPRLGYLVDLDRIAHAALFRPEGTTPDEVIERELTAAGVPGGWGSKEFRVLWHLGASTYVDLRREQRMRTPESINAEELWRAYDAGVTQQQFALKTGVSGGMIAKRSAELGFQLERRPGSYPPRWSVAAGPCLGCGNVLPIAELDIDHRCGCC
jgi:hypothetical protein